MIAQPSRYNRSARFNPRTARFSPQATARWIAAARYAIAWLVPAFLCVLVKLLTLANGRGFRVIARYLGRVEGLGFPGLTVLERISLFRSEIFYLFILIPFLLLAVLSWFPRRLKLLFTATLSVGVSLIVFLQARSLEEMGDFISMRMVRVALIWGIHDPGANKAYLFTTEFYVLLVSFGLIAVILFWAARHDATAEPAASPADFTNSASPSKWKILGAIYAVGAVIFLILASLAPLPATPYQRNILAHSIEALWGSQTVDTREFQSQNLTQLAATYRQMVNAPPPSDDPQFFGTMRGANVLIFVLETTPWKFLPADNLPPEMHTFRQLEQNSFIGLQHFTTYPYTNPALFSVFTGCYPTDGTRSFGEEHPHAHIPSLPRLLSSTGYDTALYMPSALHGEADISTFHDLGFSRYVTPDDPSIQQNWPPGFTESWKAERIARDRAMLQIAKTDLQADLVAGRRFAIAIAPQIAHLPWPDQPPPSADIPSRARAILATEDAWLAEITQLLDAHNQLSNTIIVIFGDHGIRTRREDPSFLGASLDDYSFHVPLLLYAPRTLPHPLSIPHLTSHIDIAPSILDLLAIPHDPSLEQGSPLWDPSLPSRTTFFFARQAFGTDGFYSSSRFFMWNQLQDTVSSNSSAHFDTSDIAPRDSALATDVPARIRRMIAFDQVWMEKLASAESSK